MNTSLSQRKFKTSLSTLSGELSRLEQILSELNSIAGLTLQDFSILEKFSDIQGKCNSAKSKANVSYLITDSFPNNYKTIQELNSLVVEFSNAEKFINERVSDAFLKEDNTAIYARLKSSSFISRFFDSEYKQDKARLDAFSKRKLSHGDLMKLFEKKESYFFLEKRINDLAVQNRELFMKIGDFKNPSNVGALMAAADELSAAFSSAHFITLGPSSQLVNYLYGTNAPIEPLLDSISQNISEINNYFEAPVLSKDNTGTLLPSVSNISSMLPQLSDIMVFKTLFMSLPEEARVFSEAYSTSGSKQKISEVFLKSYYLQILDDITRSESLPVPKMSVARYVTDDHMTRDMTRYQVMQKVEDKQPKRDYISTSNSELYILKREDQKKSRLKPVRNLLTAIPNLVFTLKPCFMMSPLTVSQYLEVGNINFDVVIFDEASQIMPEDAVTCLSRAKQAIIMGDTQQLPPTTFFLSQGEVMVDEDVEDLESFLSEASTRFMSDYLNWHYRSRNENLIAFSNKAFYENRLVTFPNRRIDDKSGLEFVHVKGIYGRSTTRDNEVEAKEMVQIFKKTRKEFPGMSIGMIAFSISQEAAIRAAFLSEGIEIEESLDTMAEKPFLKNLETVQGDERDIILLSIGYGWDKDGKLTYNFGPINKDGGYKRLNVAITRSRFKTIVVSSIMPEDLSETRIGSKGLRYLKRYMEYARDKKFNDMESSGGEDSKLSDSVIEALSREQIQFTPSLGSSGYKIDFAIKNPKDPQEYLVALELDGSQYDISRYARDRDLTRTGFMESQGWQIHKLWSEDWLNNKSQELETIKNLLANVSNAAPEKKEAPKFSAVDDIENASPTSFVAKYPKYPELKEVSPKKIKPLRHIRGKGFFGALNNMNVPNEKAKNIAFKILKAEAPIDYDFLCKRVNYMCGYKSMAYNITKLVDQLLRELQNEGKVQVEGKTIFIGQKSIFAPVRISSEAQRPFDSIPKEEISTAIMDIIESAFTLSRNSLISDVVRLVYLRGHAGSKMSAKVDKSILILLEAGYIDMVGDLITLKKRRVETKPASQ